MGGQILVTMGEDGKINVQAEGAFAGNKLAVLGLLDLAHAAVVGSLQSAAPRPKQTNGLLVPNGPMPNFRG